MKMAPSLDDVGLPAEVAWSSGWSHTTDRGWRSTVQQACRAGTDVLEDRVYASGWMIINRKVVDGDSRPHVCNMCHARLPGPLLA